MATGGVSGESSDEIFDNVCSVCKGQNKKITASKYCADCHDYYCSDCVNIHRTVPALRGHKVLEKEEGQSGKLPMVPTSRCDRHSFKPVDMYCQRHKAVGCYTCMAVDHRACQDVFYVPEFVKTRANVIPEFLQRMTDTETKLEKLLKHFKAECISLETNKIQEIEKIKTYTKQLEMRIKEAEKDAISEVEYRFRVLDENLHNDINNIQKELEHIISAKTDIESTIKNESQSFVTIVRSEKCALAAEEASRHAGKDTHRKRVKFLLSRQNESLMSRKLCLGKVIRLPYKFDRKGEFSIKVSSDKELCNVHGSCILTDGSILFADRSNKKLKLIDGYSYTIIDNCLLSSTPSELCRVGGNEVAVCLPKEQRVHIFKVERQLSLVRSLIMNFSCRGISYHDDRFYISATSSLYICDTQGHILKTISKDSSGKPLFSNIFNVAVNSYSKNIFVNDFDHGVICIDCDGNVLNVVSNEIKGPHGVTSADNGKMFACGFSTINVIVLDEIGAFEDVVIVDGLTEGRMGPQAVCFNCNNGHLYLPHNSRDTVKIFELTS